MSYKKHGIPGEQHRISHAIARGFSYGSVVVTHQFRELALLFLCEPVLRFCHRRRRYHVRGLRFGNHDLLNEG